MARGSFWYVEHAAKVDKMLTEVKQEFVLTLQVSRVFYMETGHLVNVEADRRVLSERLVEMLTGLNWLGNVFTGEPWFYL